MSSFATAIRRSFTDLRRLAVEFEGTRSEEAGSEIEFWRGLGNLSQLQSVRFKHSLNREDDALPAFAEFLARHELSNVDIEACLLSAIVSGLQQGLLCELRLVDTRFSADFVSAAAQIVSANAKSLTTVELSVMSEATHDTASALSSALTSCSFLKAVALRLGLELGLHAQSLVQAVSGIASLRDVQLNDFGHDLDVSPLLAGLPQLQSFEFDSNSATDGSKCKAGLLDGLTRCRAPLRHLKFNIISGELPAALEEAIGRFPLRTLLISSRDVRISPEALRCYTRLIQDLQPREFNVPVGRISVDQFTTFINELRPPRFSDIVLRSWIDHRLGGFGDLCRERFPTCKVTASNIFVRLEFRDF
eukprot:TRINITY_DN2821_c0_g2_i2.p1 TRINITY_DN2821_c0_g2~~TRINITY_DN2821_c0_g2_i2.p1  ORF type:complete len:362 (+),score=4.38 TRINITY_DN2821_c0_g2_i2:861-1946(+)